MKRKKENRDAEHAKTNTPLAGWITQTPKIPITSHLLTSALQIPVPTKARRRLETGQSARIRFRRGCASVAVFLAARAGPTARAARFKPAWLSLGIVRDRMEISFCHDRFYC